MHLAQPKARLCTNLGPVDDDNAVLIAALVPKSGLAGGMSQDFAYPSAAGNNNGTQQVVVLDALLSNWNNEVSAGRRRPPERTEVCGGGLR